MKRKFIVIAVIVICAIVYTAQKLTEGTEVEAERSISSSEARTAQERMLKEQLQVVRNDIILHGLEEIFGPLDKWVNGYQCRPNDIETGIRGRFIDTSMASLKELAIKIEIARTLSGHLTLTPQALEDGKADNREILRMYQDLVTEEAKRNIELRLVPLKKSIADLAAAKKLGELDKITSEFSAPVLLADNAETSFLPAILASH